MAPSRGYNAPLSAHAETDAIEAVEVEAHMKPHEELQDPVADPVIPAPVVDPSVDPSPTQSFRSASALAHERPAPPSRKVSRSRSSDRISSSPTVCENGSGPSHEREGNPLPAGCHWGPQIGPELGLALTRLPSAEAHAMKEKRQRGGDIRKDRVIWTDFPPSSPQDPFFFPNGRKLAITGVATVFTFFTAFNVSAYAIGEDSMQRDLGMSTLDISAGLALYTWGFAIAPLILAPLSEEFGRKWTYFISVVIYMLMHLMQALAQNIPTMLVSRLIQGAAGSVGSTLVGGTIADIYRPEQRGLPSSIFALMAMTGTGLAPVIMTWVEANPKLQWRWIQWIQMILTAALLPAILVIMRETRAPVILQRRAKALRRERGFNDGGRYTARSEIGKASFGAQMRTSLLRPLTFLVVEPVVTFFSLWISVAWGVFYMQVGGLHYIFSNIFGFDIQQVGLVYVTIAIGACIGFGCNFIQDSLYRRKYEKHGVEARLYGPMVAGVTFALGCFLYGLTSLSSVHWIVPCIGIVIILASVMTIYVCCFVYLSECYGSYASSAIAAQSFSRNMFAGAFIFFTIDVYDALTARWAIVLFGGIAVILASVPFIAFWKGPYIRSRSKYSKILMREEKERIEKEKEVLDGMG